ncbi:MAG: DUF488 domain-containing protein [Bacteroidaceae bacterium]|nr:DUF488 domain-containing protein [Bacteroidaceae bacterium]
MSNSSQLAGFAKGKDLDFFTRTICHIPYRHIEDFAPTKELLDQWHRQAITWAEYEDIYIALIKERKILQKYGIRSFDGACFLCSEDTPDYCHRRLLAEYLKRHSTDDVQIIHLV